jgi:hypothetical protein
MKKHFGQFLELSLLLGISLLGVGQSLAASSAELNPQITLRVLNSVRIPPYRLARAEQVTTRILHKAGVQVVWLDCTVATGQWQPVCDRPMGPTDFLFNFVEEIRSLSPNATENMLAFVPVPEGGELRRRAYISTRRASDTASQLQASLEMILGLAAAHEMGHMLMSSGQHSPVGLMRAQWDAKDLERAARGDLVFTADQIKQIHVGVLARIAQLNVLQAEATVPR